MRFVIALVVLIVLGAPMGVTMAILPTIYIAITGELPLSAVPYQMYEAISHQPLLAVPFFILTAELMNSGQITERLLTLARELVVGGIRGGLAQMNVLGSMMFAAMNGSAVADVAAIGGVLIPAMKRRLPRAVRSRNHRDRLDDRGHLAAQHCWCSLQARWAYRSALSLPPEFFPGYWSACC